MGRLGGSQLTVLPGWGEVQLTRGWVGDSEFGWGRLGGDSEAGWERVGGEVGWGGWVGDLEVGWGGWVAVS